MYLVIWMNILAETNQNRAGFRLSHRSLEAELSEIELAYQIQTTVRAHQ